MTLRQGVGTSLIVWAVSLLLLLTTALVWGILAAIGDANGAVVARVLCVIFACLTALSQSVLTGCLAWAWLFPPAPLE